MANIDQYREQVASPFLRNGDTESRRNGDKSVKRKALSEGRFLFTKPAGTLDFVECQDLPLFTLIRYLYNYTNIGIALRS